MLEALNAATADTHEHLLDVTAFEAFKPVTKERDYPETQVIKEDDSLLLFRSVTPDATRLVKIWYGITPDVARQDRSLRLLSFLERCRVLKGVGLDGVQTIVDFGLTRRSLLLVLDWVEGTALQDWINENPTLDARLSTGTALANTVNRLHALELAHGDIHPGNVIVRPDGTPVLIDAADLRISSTDAYTTAYLPDNYETLSPFERDRYGLAAVLVELFGSSRDRPTEGLLPIPRVYEELANLLSAETLSTLEPLVDALEKSASVEETDPPRFTVTLRNLAHDGVAAGELRHDNGMFHISAQRDRQSPQSIRLWVTGIGRQLVIVWNLTEDRVEYARVQSIPQSQLLRSQTMRDAVGKFRIDVLDGPGSDVSDLVHHILSLNELERKVSELRFPSSQKAPVAPEPQPIESTPRAESRVSARELWSSLIQAEEEALPTVTVAGESRNNRYREGQILVPYHADSGVIDYDESDTVIVESQTPDGVWLRCGTLNLRDTTFGQLAELAIDRAHPRANLRIGASLRLISVLEKSSFSRRRFAVERILEEKAVVPSLIDYFDSGANSALSPSLYTAPTDEDLEIYSDGEKNLNDSQKESFRKVLGHGPVSLLQGPPGTGKTWFIACLLHYLITKESVRRILLVSQAHEAVNNALEKGLELCNSKGTPFHAVRLGSEAATSDNIRHFHTTSIEQSYRERFKAERKERVLRLATSLGLPRTFSHEFVTLHFRLGSLLGTIEKLSTRIGNSEDEDSLTSENRIRALSETFWEIAKDVYQLPRLESMNVAITNIEEQLAATYEVRSKDAIARLRNLLRLSNEWIESLGSPDANFSEFLAKTRTVVSGTLVGIGYRATGVVQNLFDWVIIDEAGRAAPSELAVAMQAGHRILLVGDHHQLPPTFSEGVRSLIERKYDVDASSPLFDSDFARVFDSDYGRLVGSTLLTQYRMAPVIGELVSTCFYGGRLQTGRNVPPEYYDFLPEHLRTEVSWIDTGSLGARSAEQTSDDGVERWNPTEARIVMALLQQLVEAEDFMAFLEDDLQPNEPGIGIICMYSKQREFIDRMISEAVWLESRRRLVKVDTVDSYQGKENRIVILSTVRNNASFNPGFLRSPNRINVAMSRAMERLYIVGARSMWENRNAGLPLGRVNKKVAELISEGRATLLHPEHFLVN